MTILPLCRARLAASALVCAALSAQPAVAVAPLEQRRAHPATTDPDADADHDGVADHVELVLGMDPGRPDVLYHVFHDPTIAEGDVVNARRQTIPDMTDVYVGNVAGNRWVWRIDFADQFEGSGANLLLYIDADNKPETGRQGGATGTDIRLNYIGSALSTVVQNADVCARDRTPRGIAAGRSMYFCIDVNLNLDAAGCSLYRIHLLCQMAADPADADHTGWFSVAGPGVQDVPKRPAGVLSQALSEQALVQKPWLGWRDDLRALGPVVLDPDAATSEGMKRFNRALEPTATEASARWSVPVAGSYHINVLLQDSRSGREQVVVRAAGERVARFVAGQDDGDLYLFTTERPVLLSKGTTLELRVSESGQDSRLCEVCLTSSPIRPGPLRISHATAYCLPSPGASQAVDVCCLTNYPCGVLVRWGAGETLGSEAREERPTYNHRVRLTGLEHGRRYSAQVVARDGEDTAESAVLTFVAQQTRPERSVAGVKRIQLHVADAMDARPSWPVSGGVPLPCGELAGIRNCRLLDGDGRPVPAQFAELAHWPDGSVKWALVAVLHPANGGSYTLEYGSAVASSALNGGLTIVESDSGVVVTNGVLQLELRHDRFAPPGRVWLDRDGDGAFTDDECVVSAASSGLRLIDAEGNGFTSTGTEVERLVVEECGPGRAVILAEGPLTGPTGKRLSYRCRVYVYRGFPGIPVEVQLVADEGTALFPPTMHRVRSFGLGIELTRSGVGGRGRWVQDDDDHFTVHRGGEATGHDGVMSGIRSVTSGAARLSVAIRDHWQLFPKGLAFDGTRFSVELLPELPKNQYAEHTDPKLLTMNYYWFRDGAYLVPSATAAGAELLFYFGGDGEGPDAATLGRAWQEPVHLACSPEHYCASGAFMELEPERTGVFDVYQQFVRDGFAKVEEQRRERRWYSWMNYGDWYGERGVNWGNQEYDMQWGLAVQYARSADLRFLDAAATAARHTACIDQITWAPPKSTQLGIQKEHALGHTGGHEIPRVEGAKYWFANGIYNTGHMWTQGTYAVYCLTGDRRLKESIDYLSDWMAGYYCTYLERWLHRNYGWSTLAVLGAYQTEPHPFYLNAARLFLWNVMSKRDPGTGAFIHPIGECEHQPRHMGGKTFMSGVVMTALKMMDVIEPSADYKEAITGTCDWMHARMWYPEKNGFQYAQCPTFDTSPGSWNITMAGEGLAYAYELTKEQAYYEMLVGPLAAAVSPTSGSSSGKGYAMQLRGLPFALSAMTRWGLTSIPPLPPARPQVSMTEWVYTVPGCLSHVSLRVHLERGGPLTATAEITELPPGMSAGSQRVEWQVARGTSSSPLFRLSGTSEEGAVLCVRYRVGEQSGECKARVLLGKAIAVGDGVGYVGGADEPVGQALGSMGVTLASVPDLSPETLARYGALLVGSEAHEKGFAGLPASAAALLDFVRAGGRLVVMQLQDSSYVPSYLPYPLAVSNDKGALAAIAEPDHPVFTTPNRIASLTGLVSYDTLRDVDDAWRVLARDDAGNPSMVTARLGTGDVLLVQPSPDRYLIGVEKPTDTLTLAVCRQLLENLVAYLNASPARVERR